MGVNGALVVVHGAQVYARSHDHRCGRLNTSVWAAKFFERVGTGAEAGYGLDDGVAAGAFDEIEHEKFRGRDVILGEQR